MVGEVRVAVMAAVVAAVVARVAVVGLARVEVVGREMVGEVAAAQSRVRQRARRATTGNAAAFRPRRARCGSRPAVTAATREVVAERGDGTSRDAHI